MDHASTGMLSDSHGQPQVPVCVSLHLAYVFSFILEDTKIHLERRGVISYEFIAIF